MPMPMPKMTLEERKAYDTALRRINECRANGPQDTKLWLQSLGLSYLPPEIGQLPGLKELYLRDNKLTTLPHEIGQLTALTVLDVTSNHLANLPESLSECRALKRLLLHKNPGLNIPPEVLDPIYHGDSKTQVVQFACSSCGVLLAVPIAMSGVSGPCPKCGTQITSPSHTHSPRTILDYYFRNRKAEIKRPILEAKVILVGWGAVGKTSLRRRLVNDSFDLNEIQTHKIEITPWYAPVGGDWVKLHLWDFGGQEIMHATHQFFLTKRSLYVLVLAGREKVQGAQEAEYWLRLIQSFGGDSPVLVVLNKQNQCPFDLNRQSLMEKYPFIKGFVQTDCSPKLNLDVLKKMILAEVDKLPELRTEFDAKWMAIKDQVTNLKLKGRKRISVKDYLLLCRAQEEEDEKWQRWLLGFLHDLGVVVCFHEDPRLANDGVLDPQWVVDGIYTVLNEVSLKGGDGQLTRARIRELLPVANYSDDDLRVLLEMMEKFELCFRPQESRTSLVVPELMTEQEAEWKATFPDLAKCLRFELHYDFLPEGLVPRFIVATHDMSRAGERWRSGVILREGRNMALVRGDAVDRRVSIAVNGRVPTRRVLLSSIRREFAKIHRSISSLGVKEMVPVPGLDVFPLGYDDLLAAEEAGDKDWPIVAEGVRHKILIATLLDGIEPKEKRKARAKAGGFHFEGDLVLGDKFKGDKPMGDKINIGGDNIGAAIGRQASVVVGGNVSKGINVEDLANLFTQLNGQLAPLKDEMKGKDIKVLDAHLATLTEEAQKAEPDKSALAVSGKGLIEAASTVGAIAAPVLTTVGLILKFFGVSLP